MRKFYLTTAIPYVNAAPHIGHALEFVQADTIARYHKLLGEEVLLLSGGDENALKNVQAAEEKDIPIQEFVDKNTQIFFDLTKKLNCEFDIWQKGSDRKHHFPGSQKLWNLCAKNGDIYQKTYKGLYCVGCEAFYTPEELDKNRECNEHKGKKLEKIEEKNWFFRLSRYGERLLNIIKRKDREFRLEIIPEKRKHEVLSFIERGLEDISISRLNERAKNWGVPVPNDPTQRMYVWFDALNIYQSGVGFGWNREKYNKWWPADVQVIGKGILRFHAVYWPAFLLSAGLKLPKKIFVHGYITIEKQKMSKTLGNVVDPVLLIEKYGVDPLRYYFLREIPAYDDGDFSERRFKELYNSDLANNLGNLIARVAKLASGIKPPFTSKIICYNDLHHCSDNIPYRKALEEFRFQDALAFVWEKITKINKKIDIAKPWELQGEKLEGVLSLLIDQILEIAILLKPFLPETAEKILKQFEGPRIKSQPPLFPRIN